MNVKGLGAGASRVAINARGASWNISIIDQGLLNRVAYRVLETETLLNNGTGTLYSLGLGVTAWVARK